MRIKAGENPLERAQRLTKQNQEYRGRAASGWRHPKDRRGPGHRMFEKFKRGPFGGVDFISALKRDAGFPTIKQENREFFSFKRWIEADRDA